MLKYDIIFNRFLGLSCVRCTILDLVPITANDATRITEMELFSDYGKLSSFCEISSTHGAFNGIGFIKQQNHKEIFAA